MTRASSERDGDFLPDSENKEVGSPEDFWLDSEDKELGSHMRDVSMLKLYPEDKPDAKERTWNPQDLRVLDNCIKLGLPMYATAEHLGHATYTRRQITKTRQMRLTIVKTVFDSNRQGRSAHTMRYRAS